MKKKKTKTKRQPEKKAKIRHKPKKKVAGRPEVYREAMVEQVRLLAEKPVSLTQIAKCLGITVRTLQRWRKQHTALNKAITEGREVIVDEIEASQFKQALPHNQRRVRRELRGRGKKAALKVVREDIDENAVNQQAAANILRAYRADKYGDKIDHNIKGDIIIRPVLFGQRKKQNDDGNGS